MPACLIGIAVCKHSQQSRLRSRNSFTLDYSVGVYALFAVGPHIVRHSILEVCGIRVIVYVERVFLRHIFSCRAKKTR